MSPNQFKPWAETDIQTLREMSGKFKAQEIADKLGKGIDAVLKTARKLGLPRWTQPRKEKEVRAPKPIEARTKPVAPRPSAVRIPTYVEPTKPLRQAQRRKEVVSWGTLEWCPSCHSPVSNWVDHQSRMGCRRPAA